MEFVEFIKDNFLVLSLALTCSGVIIGFFHHVLVKGSLSWRWRCAEKYKNQKLG